MNFKTTFRGFSTPMAIAIAALTLTACGSIVDDAAVEKELQTEIPGLAEADMAVESVNCPDDQDFTKDATFECDFVVKDGSRGSARITITSAEGDGELEYSIARYASGQMQQFLLENIEADVALTSVNCPKTIEDGTVCTFEDGDGDPGTIALTFAADGSFDYTPEYD